ncbi:hypothetical protein ACFLQN_03065 [Candidatus Aenigmatarchaeota archaeon]
MQTNEGVCYSRDRHGDESWAGYIGGVWGEFTQGLCDAYGQASFNHPTIKVFPNLAPPLPERNRPGQFAIAEWIFSPPFLPEGVRVDYPVTSRVSYWYSSNAVINVRGFNKDEYNRMSDAGEALLYPANVVNSHASPIKVTLEKATSPIVVNQRQYGTEIAPFLIRLENVGSGFPLPVTSDAYGETGLIFGTIEVRGPGVYFYDCLGQTSGDFIFLDGLAKLRSDQTMPIGCTLGIDRNFWVDRPTDTVSLVFNLYYVYFVDDETKVTVLGVERPV